MFMSGYTGDVILRHGVSEEGVSFIQKPFSPEELAGRIRALLGPALHDPPRLS
jgi:DNA-binding response OmpR family regulator